MPVKITRPLCTTFPEQGSVDFTSETGDIDSYEGLFSFALYSHDYWLPELELNKYARGLKAYCQFINDNPFFDKWGIIIYTDEFTSKKLDFLRKFPKVIIAVVHWTQFTIEEKRYLNPEYIIEKTKIDGSVCRTLRFQALEAFPKSIILVRDADTIFNFHYLKKIDQIGNWEKLFIELWFQEGSPILLGVSLVYLRDWHTEFPFIYPLKVRNQGLKKRFKNWETQSGTQLSFKSPAGVLAGFTNFTTKRPADLWLYSFDYIVLHYKLFNNQISNHSSYIADIGKDERIIIFIMLVKYWNITYFLQIHLEDYDLLYPGYLLSAFTQKVDPETIVNYTRNVQEYTRKASKYTTSVSHTNHIIENKNIGKTVNQVFKEHFHLFAEQYLLWFNTIMTKPKEEIRQIFNEIKQMKTETEFKPSYPLDYYKTLSSNNFYEEPHRILQSSLPPLTTPTVNNAPAELIESSPANRDIFKNMPPLNVSPLITNAHHAVANSQPIKWGRNFRYIPEANRNILTYMPALIRRTRKLSKRNQLTRKRR